MRPGLCFSARPDESAHAQPHGITVAFGHDAFTPAYPSRSRRSASAGGRIARGVRSHSLPIS